MSSRFYTLILAALLISFLVVGCAGSEPEVVAPTTEPTTSSEAPSPADPALALCELLASAFSGAFTTDMTTAAAPFQDIVSGQTMDGCTGTLSVPSENFSSLGDVIFLSDSLIVADGWQEDMNYSAGGAGGIMNGYRKNGSVCTVTNELGPIDPSLCSSNEPFAVCMDSLTADQKIYKVTLNCAEAPESSTSPVGLPPASAPAVLPPAFDADLVQSAVKPLRRLR